MTKASDWKNTAAQRPVLRTKGASGPKIAEIDDRGCLCVRAGLRASAPVALQLAHWILENFGDTSVEAQVKEIRQCSI